MLSQDAIMECKIVQKFHSDYMHEYKDNGMMDFSRIEELLAIDNSILAASVVDFRGNVIATRMQNKLYKNINMEEDLFPLDLTIIKHIFDLKNDSHGKTISVVIKRENIRWLVYFFEDYFLYVVCKNDTNNNAKATSDRVDTWIEQEACTISNI